MTIRMLPDGTVEADTAAELLEWRRLAEVGRTKPPPAWTAFLSSLIGEKGRFQIVMLGVVRRHWRGVSFEELARVLEVNHQTVGGHFGGIQRKTERMGLGSGGVLRRLEDGRITAGPHLIHHTNDDGTFK